ncbi:MAG: uroporphyrinogen decarboxylase [Mariprofundales bacterium]
MNNLHNELKNDLFLRACMRKPVERTPVWMMRQAGRYLPEYRAVRQQAGGFLTLCKTPELACEVTLQPVDIIGVDAAIMFCDILVIPEAMGMPLRFAVGEGPVFDNPLRTQADIDALIDPDPEVELAYVMDAIRLIRQELGGRVPLIGFAGSPWTLATYMIQGRGSKQFEQAKRLAFNNPKTMHKLLARIADNVAKYLTAQIHAGAQAVQIFDTWGGLLGKQDYQDFSLQYMQRIIEQLPRQHEGRDVPIIVFTKGGMLWLEMIADCGCDVISLDWTIDIGEARKRVGHKVALQGNMDPCKLYADPEHIQAEVRRILASYGDNHTAGGHVFNLGHGITPDVPVEHAKAFIAAVQEYSR